MSVLHNEIKNSKWFNQTLRGRELRVLALDGGGIRGVFSAALMAKLEDELEKPIGQQFDLIAGTSTGAIVAAAIACGISAREIVSLYEHNAGRVFGSQARCEGSLARLIRLFTGNWVDVSAALGVKYDQEPLEVALRNVFEDRTLASCNRALMITATNLTTVSPQIYMTPHRVDLREPHASIVNLLLATSAAPVYFANAEVSRSQCVDGGLWANNPALVAYIEAKKIQKYLGRSTKRTIKMLSIGTTRFIPHMQPPGKDAGLLFWAPHIMRVMGLASSDAIDHQCQQLIGNRHYLRIDPPVATPIAMDDLKFVDHLVAAAYDEAAKVMTSVRKLLRSPHPR